MTQERLVEIFEECDSDWEGDNAYQGLQILAKYNSNIIIGAEHDIIYSLVVDDIIESLTEEDAIALRKLNWMLDREQFACFV